MSPSKRPPPNIRNPRSVAESVGRELQRQTPIPPRTFSEDIVDEIQEVLSRHAHHESENDLGVYLEHEDQGLRSSDGVDLSGPAQKVNFPPFWQRWFAKQTPARLAALDEIMDERLERAALRRFFKRLKHAVVWMFGLAVMSTHFFTDQVAYFVEKIPALKAFWNLVTGAR